MRPGSALQSASSLRLLLQRIRAEGLQVVVAANVLSADPCVGHAALGLGIGDLVLVEALLEGVLHHGAVAWGKGQTAKMSALHSTQKQQELQVYITKEEGHWLKVRRGGRGRGGGGGHTHSLRSAHRPCT